MNYVWKLACVSQHYVVLRVWVWGKCTSARISCCSPAQILLIAKIRKNYPWCIYCLIYCIELCLCVLGRSTNWKFAFNHRNATTKPTQCSLPVHRNVISTLLKLLGAVAVDGALKWALLEAWEQPPIKYLFTGLVADISAQHDGPRNRHRGTLYWVRN